jgi:hypothetical protein
LHFLLLNILRLFKMKKQINSLPSKKVQYRINHGKLFFERLDTLYLSQCTNVTRKSTMEHSKILNVNHKKKPTLVKELQTTGHWTICQDMLLDFTKCIRTHPQPFHFTMHCPWIFSLCRAGIEQQRLSGPQNECISSNNLSKGFTTSDMDYHLWIQSTININKEVSIYYWVKLLKDKWKFKKGN